MESTYRRWSAAEEEVLERYYGKLDTDRLCKRLGISYRRFRRKAKSMRLGYQREADEFVTMRQVREMLGIQHYAIRRFINAGLPVVYKKFGERINVMIRMSRFLNWLESNQDMWSAVRVSHMALGTEPLWLRDKRRNEYEEKR